MGASTMSCHAVAPPGTKLSARPIARSRSSGLPTPARPRSSIVLPGCARKSAIFPASPSSITPDTCATPKGEEVALIDLPGVYSLTPKSEDEKVAVDVLTGNMPGTPAPDAVILVLNSTNLHTHLVLAARVIALGLPTLVLLNMADELRKQGGHVDVLSLARQLGTPVALVSATTGEGMVAVQNFLSSAAPAPSRWNCRWSAARAAIASGQCGSGRMPSIAVRQRRSGRAPGLDLPASHLGRRSSLRWW